MRSTIKVLNQRVEGEGRIFTHRTNAKTWEDLKEELEAKDHDIDGLTPTLKKGNNPVVLIKGSEIPAGESKLYFMVSKTKNGIGSQSRYTSPQLREALTKISGIINEELIRRGETPVVITKESAVKATEGGRSKKTAKSSSSKRATSSKTTTIRASKKKKTSKKSDEMEDELMELESEL